MIPGEHKPPALSELGGRTTAQTAPVTITEKHTKGAPLSLDDEIEERPLAITNGDFMDDAKPMKALLPPSGV